MAVPGWPCRRPAGRRTARAPAATDLSTGRSVRVPSSSGSGERLKGPALIRVTESKEVEKVINGAGDGRLVGGVFYKK